MRAISGSMCTVQHARDLLPITMQQGHLLRARAVEIAARRGSRPASVAAVAEMFEAMATRNDDARTRCAQDGHKVHVRWGWWGLRRSERCNCGARVVS